MVYLLPDEASLNFEPYAGYLRGLEEAARGAQLWYREVTRDSISLRVSEPLIEVVSVPHRASHYASNDSGRGEHLWFWDNAVADAFEATGASFDDEENLWLFFLPAHARCTQVTGVMRGVAVQSERALRELVGYGSFPRCDQRNCDRCCAEGRLAALIGQAAGIERGPDPFLYPHGELTDVEQDLLSVSPFFDHADLPVCVPRCPR